jgi:inositol phosphorylceramide mannosyltransferase catalytic subunit
MSHRPGTQDRRGRTIPPVLHQIWVGPDPLPDAYAAYGETWRSHHPGWEYRLWTDDNLPAMRNRDLYDRADELTPAHNIGQFRADVLRYELLWSFGGVYVDVDFECLASIEHLLDGVDAFAAWEVQDRWIANGLMGAEPGHPFIDRLITGLEASAEHHRGQRPNIAVGPQYLTQQYRRQTDGLTVLPARLFYPYLYSDIGTPREHGPWPGALAVHHWANRRRTLARGARR